MADHDISPGQAWRTFTPSVTGITSPGGIARYCVVGSTCFISLAVNGTSNATTKTLTLPITPANITSMQWVGHLTVQDGGSGQTGAGEIVINPADANPSLYKTLTAGAWTASGAWFAIGLAFYEI